MTISIQLDADTEQRLQALALRTGKTTAFHLQELIANGMDDLEDLYMAASVMDRVKAGQEPIHSSEQVRKNLGLDN
jgi:RHH-type rel operon transcriptional repressor/antitoxin RelB